MVLFRQLVGEPFSTDPHGNRSWRFRAWAMQIRLEIQEKGVPRKICIDFFEAVKSAGIRVWWDNSTPSYVHRVETAQEKDDDKAEKEKDNKEEEEEDKEKEEKEEEKEEEDKEKEEKEEEKEEEEECGNENPLLGESDVIPFSSQSLVPFVSQRSPEMSEESQILQVRYLTKPVSVEEKANTSTLTLLPSMVDSSCQTDEVRCFCSQKAGKDGEPTAKRPKPMNYCWQCGNSLYNVFQ